MRIDSMKTRFQILPTLFGTLVWASSHALAAADARLPAQPTPLATAASASPASANPAPTRPASAGPAATGSTSMRQAHPAKRRHTKVAAPNAVKQASQFRALRLASCRRHPQTCVQPAAESGGTAPPGIDR